MPATNIFQNSSPVGSVKSSLLTLAQFQAQNGTGWVLADGQNVAGSSYASITGSSTVPDMRGQMLRGKNNGRSDGQQNPDGDVALGTQQSDSLQGHWHNTVYATLNPQVGGAGTSDAVGTVSAPNTTGSARARDAVTDTVNGTPRTSGETRAKNVTVNHFIRVN